MASGEYTISKLDEGAKISETHTMTVPNYPGDILAMKACVDGDDEIWEEGESSSGHDVDNPDQSGTTNDCSRKERFYIRHSNYSPVGAIENADCSKVVGWAKDQNITDPIMVQIFSSNPDGSSMQFLEEILAVVDRIELGGHYGFEWNIPNSLKDGISQSVYFYAINIPAGPNPLIGSAMVVCESPAILQPPQAIQLR